MNTPRTLLSIALLLMTASPQAILAQAASGPDFRVSPENQNSHNPGVTINPQGGFVVVWEARGSETDGSGASIEARRYDSEGNSLGNLFQVNTYTTFNQNYPSIGSDAAGNFVIVWQSSRGDNGDPGFSIQGQRFNAVGAPLGQQFLVNSYTPEQQLRPEVAVAPNGDFVVVWQGDNEVVGDTSSGILGRVFGSDGTPKSDEFGVNTTTANDQSEPSVAIDGSGDFVVGWTDEIPNLILGQRFDASGAPLGNEFEVSMTLSGRLFAPSIASNADGNFVATWTRNASTELPTIKGRRFFADGTPSGTEFRSNHTTSSSHFFSRVAVDDTDNSVIAWSTYYAIFARRYSFLGPPRALPFQVSTTSSLGHDLPAMSMSTPGNFVIVWQSKKDDFGFGFWEIRARLFSPPFFYDGFETGDMTGWTETKP